MATPEPPKDKVETTFELLASAKKLESESSYWLATEKFVEAHNLLRILAEEEIKKASAATAATESGDDTDGTPSAKEIENIAKLYASKADEYWKQSRCCLIKAMEQEKTRDDEQEEEDVGIDAEIEMEAEAEGNREPSIQISPPGCACALLDDDQARARNRSFSVLFSRPVATVVAAAEAQQPSAQLQEMPEGDLQQPENEDENGTNDNTATNNANAVAIADEVDLEARLRSLNQSLPTGFKTVDERMSDVHSGLGKLGMSSVYTQPNSAQRLFEDELPKSEDEQIDEILAQAQDEAMMDTMNRNVGGGDDGGDDAIGQKSAAVAAGKSSKYDDDDSSFGDEDDDESESGEEDLLLDNDQLGMKTIHKKVVKAQVKLAELLKLVDQARSKRAKEDQDEEDEIYKNNRDDDINGDSDEDSFREVQKHDVAFLMMTSKKKLKSAQRDLKKALAEWDDLIL